MLFDKVNRLNCNIINNWRKIQHRLHGAFVDAYLANVFCSYIQSGPCTRGYEQSLKNNLDVSCPKKHVEVTTRRSLTSQHEIMNPESAKGRAVLEKLIGDPRQSSTKVSHLYIMRATAIVLANWKKKKKEHVHLNVEMNR